ncbi:hypothetical protein FA15DRAFT_667550 [Coprinopsis marcescibilis]|uniref:Uncharacterized protein n=1 Tax=Coprinopsis marcescibilis TaxID=230819 RepID=A0A5C3L1N8_COPMA|nr:hypothetical protein FA15DRAFT_667550 [Coprinopsis marcescibilis]
MHAPRFANIDPCKAEANAPLLIVLICIASGLPSKSCCAEQPLPNIRPGGKEGYVMGLHLEVNNTAAELKITT